MPCSQPKASASAQGLSSREVDHAVFTLSDQISHIAETQQAFEAFEHLVTPYAADDSEKLDLDRSQLGALIRTLNRAMKQDLQAAKDLAKEARELSRALQ